MPNFDPIIEKITDYVQSFEAKENSLLEAKTCFFDSLACSFLALKYDCLLYTSDAADDP